MASIHQLRHRTLPCGYPTRPTPANKGGMEKHVHILSKIQSKKNLVDIYFNKAKLTTMIINGAANVFGHAESTIQADWFMRLMRHT